MSKKVEDKPARSLEDVLAEMSKFDALKAEAKEHIEAELAELDNKKAKLHQKLAELGFGSTVTRTRKVKDDGERKQRQCPRCLGYGHRWSKCLGVATDAWWEDERGKAEKAKK